MQERARTYRDGGRACYGAQRKKAIVAVARHLTVDLWRIHTGRCSAAQLGLYNAETLVVRWEQKEER
jgi:hypothetical protein